MSVMDIGTSALRTAYTRLQTTSHNIANASTPGYSRQEAEVTSLGAQFGESGFIGGGVDVATVSRRYDQHLTREMQTASSALSADQARASALARLDRLFSDSENGLGARFDDLNSSLADMVNQPFDQSARSVALQRAGNFSGAINFAETEMDRIRTDTDLQAGQLVMTLNDRLREVATLNEKIAAASGGRHAPNDLLDQRDALIDEINTIIQTNTHINDDNTVSLFATTGDALVLSGESVVLMLDSETDNPEVMQLTMLTEGQPVPLSQQMLGGGELSGLLRFRNDDLASALTRLGQLAGAIGDTYNRQQALGIDTNGLNGAQLFSIGPARAVPAPGNAGNAQLSIAIADGSQLQASDYQLQLTGGQYELTRLADGNVTTLAGLPDVIDGLSISLQSGAMVEGDSVVLKTGSAFAGNFAVAMQTGAQWATAYGALPVAATSNTGSLMITGFDVVAPDVNVGETVTLTFSAAGTVAIAGNGTGNPGSVSWQPGEPLSYNGWQITLAGEPTAGDSVTISPPINMDADNRNARALLALSESSFVQGRPPSQAVGALIGDVGARSLSASTNARQSEAWHTSATAARDEVSGVNLDEEAARLLQYQQAYQAAARMISTSQTMFESLMAATR